MTIEQVCFSVSTSSVIQLKPISHCEFAIRLRYDTTVGQKVDMLIFCSRRIASNGSRHARYVVVVCAIRLRYDYDSSRVVVVS